MVKIESLNPRASRYIPRAEAAAQWLLKKFKKQEYLVEITLLNSKVLAKNVLALRSVNFPRPDTGAKKILGEIYLNPDIIQKQKEDLLPMLIHGFLHLIGHKHKSKRDTIRMEKLEKKLFYELYRWLRRRNQKFARRGL